MKKIIMPTEQSIYLGKLWGWCLNGDRRHSWRWEKNYEEAMRKRGEELLAKYGVRIGCQSTIGEES